MMDHVRGSAGARKHARGFAPAFVVACALVSACKSAPARDAGEDLGRETSAPLAEFWQEPSRRARSDLFYGAGGRELAPAENETYTLLERDTGGFSTTYDVRDGQGREWSVKIGPEAQSEVASSRIVWAAGFHQPPAYLVSRWLLDDNGRLLAHGGARFRPKLEWLKPEGSWAWANNPFVGTQAYRGLLVLMALLNNTDLKDENNGVYELAHPAAGAGRWYVVKDLGASLGETGWGKPRRNYLEGFEKHGFIAGFDGPRVRFESYGGREELFEKVTAADVRWVAGLLGRLSQADWREAFRAGGYGDGEIHRYVDHIRARLDQVPQVRAGASR